MIRQPKYQFGLLETPEPTDMPATDNSSSAVRRSGSLSSDVMGNAGNPGTSFSSRTPNISNNSSSFRRPQPFSTSSSIGSSTQRMPLSTPRPFGSSRSRTPGSRRTPYITSSTTPAMDSSAVLAAVVEGRGLARGEVGMASIDLKHPVLTLSQFADTQTCAKTMTKLMILKPIEIIMPNTVCEANTSSKLFSVVSEHYPDINIAVVQRKYFNETTGLQYIKQLCIPEFNTVEMEVSSKYYCLAAAAALLKYVEFIQNILYAPASLKVVFKGSENTTMIDAATATHLELLQNAHNPKSQHSLYGVLNSCKTAGGARMLRSNILQPPCEEDTITLRHDAVASLTEDEDMFLNLQSALSRCTDIEHMLSIIVQIPKQETVRTAEAKISSVIHLKDVLELVDVLKTALQPTQATLLKAYLTTLEDPRFDIIMEKIRVVIHEDARYQKGALNMKTQKCFAVKPNINGLLDVARRTYTELIDDMAELVQQLSQKHNLPLKTAYTSARGFHIQLYTGGTEGYSAATLPKEFVKVSTSKNMLSFQTIDLIRLNDRINESLQEIYLMTNIVMTELLKDIRDHIGCLFKLTECVSMLDMLVAFTHNCTLSDQVRPELTDTLAIKQGRHPILERFGVDAPVANNIYCSEDSNFIIITGPNMSGKSTYLRQIALLQIMAQIGSFVPAEYASIRVADQIFSRIGCDDSIETNSSTFTVEMREVNYIVQNASDRSLIIIDELGRGTSADEGTGICYAVCEYLIHLKAYTFFTTHFFELTRLDTLYHNAENYHFEVQREITGDGQHNKIIYSHTLSKGRTQEKHYGIQLAEVTSLPKTIIEDSKQLADQLAMQKQRQDGSKREDQENATMKLATKLVQVAKNSRLDESNLRCYLKSLRKQFKDTICPIAHQEE